MSKLSLCSVLLLPLLCVSGCSSAATLGGHTFPRELSPPVHAAKAFLEDNAQLQQIAGDHGFQNASLVQAVGLDTREVHTTLVTASARGDVEVVVEPLGNDQWRVQRAVLHWQGRDLELRVE